MCSDPYQKWFTEHWIWGQKKIAEGRYRLRKFYFGMHWGCLLAFWVRGIDKLPMFSIRQRRWQGPSAEPSVRTLHLSNARMLHGLKYTQLHPLGRHGSRSRMAGEQTGKTIQWPTSYHAVIIALTVGLAQQTSAWRGPRISFLNQHSWVSSPYPIGAQI